MTRENTGEEGIPLEKRVRELLQLREVGALATQGPDFPHLCLVAFEVTEDLGTILFVTSRETRKFHNLRADGRVIMLVDNRSHTREDFYGATAVTGRGRAAEIPPEEAAPFLDMFLERHPYMEEFARAPDTALIAVQVESYAVVTRFQEVVVLPVPCAPGARGC